MVPMKIPQPRFQLLYRSATGWCGVSVRLFGVKIDECLPGGVRQPISQLRTLCDSMPYFGSYASGRVGKRSAHARSIRATGEVDLPNEVNSLRQVLRSKADEAC